MKRNDYTYSPASLLLPPSEEVSLRLSVIYFKDFLTWQDNWTAITMMLPSQQIWADASYQGAMATFIQFPSKNFCWQFAYNLSV